MKKIDHSSINSINSIQIFSDDLNFKLFAIRCESTQEDYEVLEGSFYGYVFSGTVEISTQNFQASIQAQSYFAVNEGAWLRITSNSSVVLIHNKKLKVLNTVGGPIEDLGRLKYIDGCTDTVLISPSKLGESCLNYLHFPKETKQTMHTHPSFRFGIVARGEGQSVSPDGIIRLKTGDVFLIHKGVEHKFDTFSECMDVIAFHPDSDWGPTDEVHPMINRTWVNGEKITSN